MVVMVVMVVMVMMVVMVVMVVMVMMVVVAAHRGGSQVFVGLFLTSFSSAPYSPAPPEHSNTTR